MVNRDVTILRVMLYDISVWEKNICCHIRNA